MATQTESYDANSAHSSSRPAAMRTTEVSRPSRDVEIHRYADGSRAYERLGDTLTTPHADQHVVQSLVRHARENNWKHVYVQGSDAFRSRAWEEGAALGIDVLGYQPTAAQKANRPPVREPEKEATPPSLTRETDNALRPANAIDRASAFIMSAGERVRQWGDRLAASTKVLSGKLKQALSLLIGWLASRENENTIEYVEPKTRKPERQRESAWLRTSRSVDFESVPEQIQASYIRQGDSGVYLHESTRREAFRDGGSKLTTQGEDLRVIKSLIHIAEARDWRAIQVKGSQEFRREAWLNASFAGLEVRGYSPTSEDQKQLQGMRERSRQASGRDSSGRTAAPASRAPSAVQASDQSARNPADDRAMRPDAARTPQGERQAVTAEALQASRQYQRSEHSRPDDVRHAGDRGNAVAAHPKPDRGMAA